MPLGGQGVPQEVSLQRGTGKAEGHGPVRFPSRPPSGTTVAEMFASAGFQELLNPFQEKGLGSPNSESKQVGGIGYALVNPRAASNGHCLLRELGQGGETGTIITIYQ